MIKTSIDIVIDYHNVYFEPMYCTDNIIISSADSAVWAMRWLFGGVLTWRPWTPCREDRRTTSKRSVMSRWSRNMATPGAGNPPEATHRTRGRGNPAMNVRVAGRWPPSRSSTSVDLLPVVMYSWLIGAVHTVV